MSERNSEGSTTLLVLILNLDGCFVKAFFLHTNSKSILERDRTILMEIESKKSTILLIQANKR